jgi:glycerol-3-phosphate dehydrogenase
MADVLGWDRKRRRREVEAYTARVEAERASQDRYDDAEADEARASAPEVRTHL